MKILKENQCPIINYTVLFECSVWSRSIAAAAVLLCDVSPLKHLLSHVTWMLPAALKHDHYIRIRRVCLVAAAELDLSWHHVHSPLVLGMMVVVVVLLRISLWSHLASSCKKYNEQCNM